MAFVHLIALASAAPAVPMATDDAPIEIVASRKTYRLSGKQLRDAVETFNRERGFHAPHARLWFERQGTSSGERPLRLRMVRGQEVIDLHADGDGRYSLPPLDFRKGDWELRANKAAGTIRLRAITLSPGSDDADRRLGDLRLNCRVMMAIVRHELSLGEKAMLGLAGDACKSSRVSLYAGTDHDIAVATLVEGGRRADVPLSADRRAFRLPTYRKDFSNEARLRITLQ